MSTRGAAISTTGDEHRMRLLRQSAEHWRLALPVGAPLFVTVDGDDQALDRAVAAVGGLAVTVLQVGQRLDQYGQPTGGPRLGVAANKNTGIEALMDWCGDHPYPMVENLFLSDDDSWPRHADALDEMVLAGPPHLMVCWGAHRRPEVHGEWASWKWPRGAILYTRRDAVVRVGGMVEAFGPGGHEHVEWSRRIHQAFLTPAPFVSPAFHAERRAMGAARDWHCEDMQRPGEPLGNLRLRRRKLTSVRRADGDWEKIEALMAQRDGDTTFVPFRAAGNGRAPATMSSHSRA